MVGHAKEQAERRGISEDTVKKIVEGYLQNDKNIEVQNSNQEPFDALKLTNCEGICVIYGPQRDMHGNKIFDAQGNEKWKVYTEYDTHNDL